MKTHNATSTPAASACQPDAVRGEPAQQVSISLWSARLAFLEIFAVMDRLNERISRIECDEIRAELEVRYHNISHLHDELTVAVGFTPSSSVGQVR
ncbi:hypothetical protein AmDm5_0497 [Acetobacter malorum]|uniref:Uncharacterized protein n=1 Tax=Acetobacter malorum TaxID=178901 RepID=A0A087PXF3_9PROT|nr:hypothetical protein [Acetobacter malorum]KFL92056.1 hypothetical protein AmDm5_0497 [Acetobacter malorum]OAG78492.1 hypothetical protein Amal_00505 [Acetobacter malorum]